MRGPFALFRLHQNDFIASANINDCISVSAPNAEKVVSSLVSFHRFRHLFQSTAITGPHGSISSRMALIVQFSAAPGVSAPSLFVAGH